MAPPEHLGRRVRSIVDATGEAAYASGWTGGEAVALYTARGKSPVGAAQVPIGYSGFAHARAAGKLLLALADPATVEAYLDTHPLEPRTARTITGRDELRRSFSASGSPDMRLIMRNSMRDLLPGGPSQALMAALYSGISVPSNRFEHNFRSLFLGVDRRRTHQLLTEYQNVRSVRFRSSNGWSVSTRCRRYFQLCLYMNILYSIDNSAAQ